MAETDIRSGGSSSRVELDTTQSTPCAARQLRSPHLGKIGIKTNEIIFGQFVDTCVLWKCKIRRVGGRGVKSYLHTLCKKSIIGKNRPRKS